MKRSPERQKSRMMRQEFQEKELPPHWRASRRQTFAGTKMDVPRRSNFWISLRWNVLTRSESWGRLRKKVMMAREIPPTGKLM